jgi:hypothetical protein
VDLQTESLCFWPVYRPSSCVEGINVEQASVWVFVFVLSCLYWYPVPPVTIGWLLCYFFRGVTNPLFHLVFLVDCCIFWGFSIFFGVFFVATSIPSYVRTSVWRSLDSRVRVVVAIFLHQRHNPGLRVHVVSSYICTSYDTTRTFFRPRLRWTCVLRRHVFVELTFLVDTRQA